MYKGQFNTCDATGTGAIFGLGGALAMFFYRHKPFFGKTSDDVLGGLRTSLLINVIYGGTSHHIDNW